MEENIALFRGVQARDPEAWSDFVDRFGPIVLATVRRAGCHRGEDEDVCQSTWARLLDHASLIGAPRSLPAWVIRTAQREAWRVVRRRRDGALVERAAGEERAMDMSDCADEAFERLEHLQAVRDELAGLSGRCGELLRALFFAAEDPEYSSISSNLGMPVGSIGPTRSRCLAKLAAALAARGIEAPR